MFSLCDTCRSLLELNKYALATSKFWQISSSACFVAVGFFVHFVLFVSESSGVSLWFVHS
jgi:hypothetical protein